MQLTPRQQQLLEFVKQQHGEQKRKYTGEPYWHHPLAVASRFEHYCGLPLVEIALCHDLFEDTQCNEALLTNTLYSIGYEALDVIRIVNGVKDLTDQFTPSAYPDFNRSRRKLKEAMRLCQIADHIQSIKYADMIDNTKSIIQYDPNFAKVYLEEKRQLLHYMRNGDIELLIEACYWVKYGQDLLFKKS
jgi:(p)ppGpp synthase/HD superfamily hydrolase